MNVIEIVRAQPVAISHPLPRVAPAEPRRDMLPTEAELREAYEASDIPTGPRALRASAIIALVARLSGLTSGSLTGGRRTQPIIFVRQQAMWLVADKTQLSYLSIGRLFDRGHTSVIEAVRQCNARSGANVRGLGARPRRRPIPAFHIPVVAPAEPECLDEATQDLALAMLRDELRDTKEIAWRLEATEAAVANGIARARERERQWR